MSIFAPTKSKPLTSHKPPKNTILYDRQLTLISQVPLPTLPSPLSMRPGKMHGFLCQSQASTAVCIPGDPRSAIVPRRPDRTLIGMDQHRHVDWKYARLGEPRRFSTSSRPEKRFHAVPKRERTTTTAITTTAVVPSKPRTINAPSKAITVVPPPLTPTHGQVFQVVVMRVSIHCQGCAGKVKKHISKMEGVTSFSIDLESKRVTVMGHISPVGVLESISKIKKAEFWHTK